MSSSGGKKEEEGDSDRAIIYRPAVSLDVCSVVMISSRGILSTGEK